MLNRLMSSVNLSPCFSTIKYIIMCCVYFRSEDGVTREEDNLKGDFWKARVTMLSPPLKSGG